MSEQEQKVHSNEKQSDQFKSAVFAISGTVCLMFRNYVNPYGGKKVQTDFLMLKNWNPVTREVINISIFSKNARTRLVSEPPK